MIVQIAIIDNRQSVEAEKAGMDAELVFSYTPFYFDSNLVIGFWVDDDVTGEGKMPKEIIFHLSGFDSVYRCKYELSIENIFKQIIMSKDDRHNF